jgi:hypothetical protein
LISQLDLDHEINEILTIAADCAQARNRLTAPFSKVPGVQKTADG